ncbi:uncharacterized protein LOC141590330 [Silene latifolia]|uniref:uncharacterized protein LOC141590330 n=1 Tax=Silene latifolia TaxID=37657 RepID=UPI003D77D1E1
MEDYCARWNIKLFKSTPRNPQYNGQAESINKIVMNNLKRRLEEIRANWEDELRFVLWSDRTTPKVATGHTPFSLLYGAEAVIPSEVQVPTHRYANATEERNQVEMASSLDSIDEPRTSTQIRMAAYKQTAARSYNKNVRLRTPQVDVLVLKKLSLEGERPQNPLAETTAHSLMRKYSMCAWSKQRDSSIQMDRKLPEPP